MSSSVENITVNIKSDSTHSYMLDLKVKDYIYFYHLDTKNYGCCRSLKYSHEVHRYVSCLSTKFYIHKIEYTSESLYIPYYKVYYICVNCLEQYSIKFHVNNEITYLEKTIVKVNLISITI